MPDLDEASVAYWLKNGAAHRVIYPNVAEAVVEWMLAGDPRIDQEWVRSVWDRVVYQRTNDAFPPAVVRCA